MAYNLKQSVRTHSDRVVTRHILRCSGAPHSAPSQRGFRMSEHAPVIAANLGPHVAAFTCRIHDRPAAVVNSAARDDPDIRRQAIWALLGAGLDAGHIIGALNGIRS